mgnify:CR=1 FL=1
MSSPVAPGSVSALWIGGLLLGVIETASKYLASDWGSLFFFVAMAVLLANYFYDTVAPQNVSRVRAMTGLLLRNGTRSPPLEKMAREAAVIEKTAPATKASVRSFLDAYQPATAAALQGHAVQTAGKCDKATLKSVTSTDIRNAEYLPLTGKMVEKTYLVRGEWAEFWTFDACGEEVPVKHSSMTLCEMPRASKICAPR